MTEIMEKATTDSGSVLSAQLLRERLSYDPAAGVFHWRRPSTTRVRIGAEAGSRRGDGYVRIKIDKRDYLAHRLAWLYVTGGWPRGEVDHLNSNPSDNRWSNLRDVPPVVNQQNQRRAHKRSGTGLLGASFCARRGKYVAQIVANGKHRWLGYHQTAEAAHAAYVNAKRQLHEGNTL